MINIKRIKEICSQFDGKRIMVFGDVILDRYIFGQAERISPEAPVPIIKVEKEETRLGGAGNVALNIDQLGAESMLFGICGQDQFGKLLHQLKTRQNYIANDKDVNTIVKTRVISGRQQIVRIDRETNIKLNPNTETRIIQKIKESKCDGIIVSDYAKGTLSKNIMAVLREKAKENNAPLIIDPKPANISLFNNIDGITPNLKEAELIINKKIINPKDIFLAIGKIRKKCQARFSVITMGDKGIAAGEKGRKTFIVPAYSHEVYDVTGAGDTVVSVITLALTTGASLKESVYIANVAASIVVERIGTIQPSREEIFKRAKFLLANRNSNRPIK